LPEVPDFRARAELYTKRVRLSTQRTKSQKRSKATSTMNPPDSV